MQIAKWGNSLAVRIPVDVARALDLKEGDDIELRALGDDQYAVVTEQQRRREVIRQIRSMAVKLPDDFKFDREEANAR